MFKSPKPRRERVIRSKLPAFSDTSLPRNAMQLHPTGRFDNRAHDYRHILAHPLAAAMGAEIRGVDVAKVTDAQFEEIRHALFQHKMIFFRDQNITHADHAAFSVRFGPFAEDA